MEKELEVVNNSMLCFLLWTWTAKATLFAALAHRLVRYLTDFDGRTGKSELLRTGGHIAAAEVALQAQREHILQLQCGSQSATGDEKIQ